MSDRSSLASRHQGEGITLADSPAIPGLCFRRLAGPSDYAGIARLREACALEDGSDEMPTEADIANSLENPVDMDPSRDLILGEVDDAIVAMHSSTLRFVDGAWVANLRGFVHPSWRRRGLGRTLFGFGERRARAVVPPDAGDQPGAWQAIATSLEQGAHALYRSSGYSPFRYAFTMTRDLSNPIPPFELPPSLEIRPARPEHFRAIWEAEREAFQDAWGYSPWPEENYQRFLGFPHYDPALWRVAWDGDRVAGMVLSFVNAEENAALGRSRGYTEDIAVRRPWRRKGVASALLADSLRALQALGLKEAALGVDAESLSRALRLYENLGFRTVIEWTFYRRPWPSE
jgi:ribosomal protein S18 acetylase RimI-like enzyme